MFIFCIITPAVKYPTVVIPAKAGIQKGAGCRIKSGMTGCGYLVAGLVNNTLKKHPPHHEAGPLFKRMILKIQFQNVQTAVAIEQIHKPSFIHLCVHTLWGW